MADNDNKSKDEVRAEKKLRKEIGKDKNIRKNIQDSMPSSSPEQVDKMVERMIDKLTKEELSSRAERDKQLTADRDQRRQDDLTSKIAMSKGISDTMAASLAEQQIKQEKSERKKSKGLKKLFFSIKDNFNKTPEEKKEEADRQSGLFKGLKKVISGMGKGAKVGGGIFGGIMKTIKKVFGLLKLKFLFIGALVVGMISQLNLGQLKKIWEGLKEAFTAIYEFLKPIVITIWNWIGESLVPTLVDFFVKTLKDIGTMFTSIKERFEGWGEMSFSEKCFAILDVFGDLGTFIGNLAGNLVEGIVNIFGGDGEKAKKEYWEPIQKFFGDFFSGIKLLFSDPAAGLKKMWNSVFGKDGLGSYFWEKFIKPLANFLKNIATDIIGDKWSKRLGLTKETPAEIAAKKEKEARFQAGKDAKNKYTGLMGGMDQKELDNAAPQELKDMIAMMKETNQDKTNKKDFQKILNAKKKADEKQAKIDAQSAITDASNKANVDAGGFANYSAFHSSAEGKAFLNQKFGGKGFSPKKGKAAFEEYQKQGHMGAMDSSELGQIKKDEGFRKGVYKDTMGIKTIGYGFNLERAGSQEALDAANITSSLEDLKSGKMKLTEEEASRLMMGEMGHFRNVAKRYVGEETWKNLSSNRQGILTNMAYNMGEGTLSNFKDLKAAIVKGDWKQAQVEMKDSNWSKQVKGRSDRLIARMGQNDSGQKLASAQLASSTMAKTSSAPVVITKNNSTSNSNSSYTTNPSTRDTSIDRINNATTTAHG